MSDSRFYRQLLRLFPSAFRERFEIDMTDAIILPAFDLAGQLRRELARVDAEDVLPRGVHVVKGVETWQVMEGVFKSIFFGAAIGLISCYKGFTCGSGASGVGRACTESFVQSFIAIIVLNFFFAQFLREMYEAIYGIRGAFD